MKLEPLKYPVYFLTKDVDRWQHLFNADFSTIDLDTELRKVASGNDIWGVQTYLQLKSRGLNVHLVPRPIRGQICIAPYHFLYIKDFAFHSYMVGSQLDSARPEICEQRTVLSPACLHTQDDYFIPQWPQTNLIPRDQSRGTRLEILDFKGDVQYNLAKPFQSPEFLASLEKLGIQFVHSSTDPVQRLIDFADYSRSDAVIAVRNITNTDLKLKPPTKLINAWHGGCPAILGPEPSFQALRQSELDYFEVHSPEDAIAALQKLKEMPNLYQAVVENGFMRAQEYTADRISAKWYDLLQGPITWGYERWLRQSLVEKTVGRPLKFVKRTLAHREAIRDYLHQRDFGERLFAE
ncbi:glycosyltransferase family 1 protein [Nodosilinea sp. LEGE 06152]|uniref:glycosyltransferase n=1 Tax=Nodosilinea sp. LEGE 06152 TaxID=2777966 RepID=UPI0018824DFC|nr:glycosyltransferase family 1 protein [Nodosilinea sp. LEGE 06152]MBE9158333.1 glycosyltransferase family 1 protein [Nodosilinea sp. LEGE 06152]